MRPSRYKGLSDVKTDNSALANCLFSATINGMIMRFYYVTGAFVLVGLIVFASFWFFPKPKKLAPMLTEELVKKYGGPFISDFLGLSFPGQYAPFHGIGNIRREPYVLTEEERERAIKKLQDTFQTTQKISVTIGNSKEFLLLYDQCLAIELSKYAALMGDTRIDSLSALTAGSPDIVFTLHPSDVQFVFLTFGTMYATLRPHDPRWRGHKRWRGDMDYLRTALLDTRLQDGETVRSVARRVLGRGTFLDRLPTENGNAEDQTDSE